MQVFQDCAELMKKPVNQIREAIDPPRKPRPTKESFDQSEFVQNKAAFLEITAEMQHRSDGNGDDFRVCDFNARIFAVSARLEKIIDKTVYCKSAMARWFVLFWLNLFGDKILKEDILYFKYQIL